MLTLIDVILPVFLVVGLGYVSVWKNILSNTAIDGIMAFAQKIAIPFLLFGAISQIDLSVGFSPSLLGSFYGGATICFALGIFGSRFLFKRDWEDSIVIGFGCLFSNSVLLGLPITERAYGTDNLSANFAIIAFHAPFCYALGITMMEIIQARGTGIGSILPKVLKAMFKNALIIGILAGFAVNLGGVSLPTAATDAAALVARAGLPVALFGLGGVLYHYRPEGDFRIIAMVCGISLLVHPTLVFFFGSFTDLPNSAIRSMVLTSAMAPGINAYLFADMYGRAKRVAASSVLIATGLTAISAWGWLQVLA